MQLVHVAVAATTGVLLAGGVAVPASADDGICPVTNFARGCFWNTGHKGKVERVKVSDDKPDGHSAVIQWRLGNKRKKHELWDHNGSRNGWDRRKARVREGRKVRVRLCKGEWDDKRTFHCGPWLKARA